MAKIIKEIIIMLLVCLVTMLVLAISLYKFIPNRKIVPEIATYKASEEVQDLLEDNIDQNTNQTSQNIATYEVTAGELKGYQKTNIYVPGKSNPFAPASKSVSGDGEIQVITTKMIIQIVRTRRLHQVFTKIMVQNNFDINIIFA